ncbi:beta-ketoacyl synthase chain length factor [Telmatospirillum sp.]|uniref:beta-ketoacyl synthase chain length factor n=1 Tax=Telmatospirillum sp. TaxID=2079197 RepID=UPI002840CBE8|nr:beta-ketoacyl synthase chain length factor [Telmatospirillum sp.]MDR3439077.1 beta-ketoacyl synthase chain length factor [Telmatospirillum sp.]
MPSPSLCFQIKGWAAWTPTRETKADWLTWATERPADAVDEPAPTPPPLLLRRRVSGLGQKALRAAWGLPDVATARLVFASRHGEFTRTLSIMDSLVGGTEVSPADFSLSVHHALAGLLSIATDNRQGHTAIGAGPDSFFCGLLEAAACLAETPDQPVVTVYYDEPLPTPFDRFGRPEDEPIAVAMTLAPRRDSQCLCLSPTAISTGTPASVTPAQDFLGFLLGRARQTTITGDRCAWHLEKTDAPH